MLSLRLNVAGTIIGAVLASVVTTLGAVFYQRTMEREKRWQIIAVGGLLAFVVTVLTFTSVQLVTGQPVGAKPRGTVTQTETETSTPPETKTETKTVTAPPSTSGQSPTESTTTTGPTTTTTESRQPTDSSPPTSTVDPIR